MNKSTLALLLALAVTPFASAQNLISNGSFETGAGAGNGPTVSGPSEQAFISGWTAFVPSGYNVTFTQQTGSGPIYPTAIEGSLIFNMGGYTNDNGVGGIYQNFTTSPGQSYQLSYFMGGLPVNFTPNTYTDNSIVTLKTDVFAMVDASTVGATLFTNTSSSGAGALSGTLDPYSFAFTATSNLTRLTFTADYLSVAGQNQLNIDAVSVSAIPEPSTYAAMAGAAMLGLAIYRRRRVAAPVSA